MYQSLNQISPVIQMKHHIPSHVQHIYEEDQPRNDTTRWYWLAGEFYAFQPLNLFLFRSLLFSPPAWRKECVVLCLPDECLSNDFLKYLTQRVS